MIRQAISRFVTYWRAFFLLLLLGFVFGIVFAFLSWRYRMQEGGLFSMALLESGAKPVPDFRDYFVYLFRRRAGTGLLIGALGVTMLGIPVIMAGLLWLGFLAGALCTMGILQSGLAGFAAVLGALLPQILFCLPGLFLFLAVVYRMSERSRKRERMEWRDYGSYLLWCIPGAILFFLGTAGECALGPEILRIFIGFVTKN